MPVKKWGPSYADFHKNHNFWAALCADRLYRILWKSNSVKGVITQKTSWAFLLLKCIEIGWKSIKKEKKKLFCTLKRLHLSLYWFLGNCWLLSGITSLFSLQSWTQNGRQLRKFALTFMTVSLSTELSWKSHLLDNFMKIRQKVHFLTLGHKSTEAPTGGCGLHLSHTFNLLRTKLKSKLLFHKLQNNSNTT